MLKGGLGLNTDWLRRLWRSGQPFCLVQKSSNQSINDVTNTDITWQTDLIDPWGMHDTVSNTEQITIPISGRYLCVSILTWDASATGVRSNILTEVGSLNKTFATDRCIAAGAGTSTVQLTGAALELTAGVYVKVVGHQSSGGSLNVLTNNTITQFMVARIG